VSQDPISLTRPNASVRVPKVAELVASDLRRRILRGELSAGDSLPNESALLELFDVSRPTMREALRILENDGLISVKRGAHNPQVQLPDSTVTARHAALLLQLRSTTIEDVFTARRVLEPAAVRMLAERPSKAAIAKLRDCQQQEQAVLDEPDSFAKASTAFHQLLVQLAGNNTLALMSEMILEIVDSHHATLAGASGRQHEYAEQGSDHHHRVIELIADGKADEAEAFWRFHIDGAAAGALRHLGPKTILDLLG
jgi:DNA-binding FadR family transcriptional regulator